MPYKKAYIENNTIAGTIDVLDVQYGNVWTNIGKPLLDQLGIRYGDMLTFKIFQNGKMVFNEQIKFGETFSAVNEGRPIAYLNSLMNFSVGINMGNFAAHHNVSSGPGWTVIISKVKKP